jgi:hypothetical protein
MKRIASERGHVIVQACCPECDEFRDLEVSEEVYESNKHQVYGSIRMTLRPSQVVIPCYCPPCWKKITKPHRKVV